MLIKLTDNIYVNSEMVISIEKHDPLKSGCIIYLRDNNQINSPYDVYHTSKLIKEGMKNA